jgi:hypothetical protein
MPRIQQIPGRACFEAALTCVSATLTALTLVWHEWLEALGFDADNGDGSVEWVLVGALLLLTLALAFHLRFVWRKTQVGAC